MNAIQRVQEAIKEIQKGNMVIMLDDEDRENEGDLVYAAPLSTAEKVNFMATHAKGLICVSVTKETANRLQLNPMVSSNTSSYETALQFLLMRLMLVLELVQKREMIQLKY